MYKQSWNVPIFSICQYYLVASVIDETQIHIIGEGVDRFIVFVYTSILVALWTLFCNFSTSEKTQKQHRQQLTSVA